MLASGQHRLSGPPTSKAQDKHCCVITITAYCFGPQYCFPREVRILLLPVILSLTVLWLVFGVVITRRLGKPTCRVCIFRQFCRNRESQHSNPTNKPLELRPDRSMHNAKARSAIINLPSAASARRVVALNYTLN